MRLQRLQLRAQRWRDERQSDDLLCECGSVARPRARDS